MRCLVTGATGHVGSFLVRRLLDGGHAVHVLLRPESDQWRLRDLPGSVTRHLCSLDLPVELDKCVKAAQPDIVFHLAWGGITAERRNDPEQVSSNVRQALSVLEAAHAAGCSTFISVGSQAEYGRVDGVIREDHATHPETAYGVAKLALSQLATKYCELAGIRCVWLRLFSAYGPMDTATHMLPTLIETLLRGERPALTRCEQQWDYLYIENVAEALYQTAITPTASGIFNLSSGTATPLLEVVTRVRDLIDPALPLGIGEVAYRDGQVMHLEGDIARLRAATGWQPHVSLEDGLARTVAWHRSPHLGS
ncbi:MAG: NAD-dependent epimerase/dehydratase family protein [Acidobacteriaceae bacterium]